MNRTIASTLLILLALTSTGWGQSLMAVQEIHYPPNKEVDAFPDSVFVFPKFVGSSFTQKINQGLLEYLNSLSIDENFSSITEAFDSLRYNREKNQSGLIRIWYEVFHSKNTVSVELHTKALGANRSFSDDYLTFSTLTGNRLTLDSLFIIQEASALHKIISQKQEEYISNYKQEMLKLGYETHNDSSKFEGAVEYAKKYCFNNFSNRDFIIDKNSIKINVACGFPPNGKPVTPAGDLIIEKNSIETVLKKDYLN